MTWLFWLEDGVDLFDVLRQEDEVHAAESQLGQNQEEVHQQSGKEKETHVWASDPGLDQNSVATVQNITKLDGMLYLPKLAPLLRQWEEPVSMATATVSL